MATFKATSKKKDSGSNVFKATEKKSYDSSYVNKWEEENKEALVILENYITKRNNGDWFSEEEVKEYQSALDRYKSSSSSLLDLKKSLGSYKDEDQKNYDSYISDLSSDLDSIYKLSSSFKSKDEYDQAVAEHTKLSMLNTEDYAKSIQDLESFYSEVNKLYSEYEKDSLNWDDNEWDNEAVNGNKKSQPKYMEKLRERGFNSIEELRSHIDGLQETYNKAYVLQNTNRVKKDSDQYDPEMAQWAEKGKAIENPSYEDAQGWFALGTFRLGDEEVQNPVTFTRDNYDQFTENNRYASMNGGVNQEYHKINDLYMQMEEEEVNAYSALLAQDKEDGGNRAEVYLNAINKELEQRKAGELSKPYIDSPALGLIFTAGYSAVRFGHDMETVFANTEGAKSNPSVSDYMASTIALENNEKWGYLPEVFGKDEEGNAKTVYGALNDAAGTIGYMLPSILAAKLTGGLSLTAGLSSAAANTVGAVVGSGAMGLGAAGSGYQEMLNLGYSKDQAGAYGVMIGAAEGLTSYALSGISAVGGKLSGNFIKKVADKVDNAIARFAIKHGGKIGSITENFVRPLAHGAATLGGNIGSEILEEEIQLWLEPAIKKMVLDVDFEAPTADDMMYTALVTAFSTFLLEGKRAATTEVNTYKKGKNLKTDGKVDRLVEQGKLYAPETVAHQIANKVNKDTGAYTIGKLFNEMGASLSEQNISDITKALVEKGFTQEQAEIHADWMNHVVEGGKLTERQRMALETNDVLAEVLYGTILQPNSTVMQRTQAVNNIYGVEGSMGVDREALEASQTPEAISQRLAEKKALGEALLRGANPRKGLSSEQIAEIDTIAAAIASIEEMKKTTAETIDESNYSVSVDGQMVNTKTGDTIKPQGLVQAEDGTYMIAAKDADPVSRADVSYSDKEQAYVYESFLTLEDRSGTISKVIADMDLDSRNALLDIYNRNVNASGKVFVKGALDAFFYGHRGIDMSTASKDSPMMSLTTQQRQIAWNIGRAAGIKSTTKAQSNVDTVYAEANKALKQSGKSKGNYNATLDDGISPMQLNEKQKAVYNLADDIAKGVQSKIRVYAGKNKAQGFYNHATDEIWLNLNAADTSKEAIMAFTLAHELVHRGKKGSPAKYQAFVDFLLKEYGKQGADLEKMIAQELAAAEEFDKTVPANKKINMTREKALEEVVCDACQRMLLDTNAGQKLAEFGAQSKQNKSFLEDLKRWISELLDKLRNYFKGVDPDSLAAKEFAKFDANVKQILADMYVDMSIDAGEKLSTIYAAGDAFVEKLRATKDIQYNLELVKTHKDKLQKEFSEDSATDLDTIMKRYDKIVDIWTKLGGELNSKFLEEWNSKVGKDRTFTIFKAQAGYKYNVELSSMCKKGVPLFEAIDTIVKQEVMKELGTNVLGKAEKEILYDILKQHNFEIPCAICYVEQARQREGVIIDAFLNGKVDKNSKGQITKVKLGWNQVLDSIQKEMKANGVDYTFAQVSRDIATEKYSPANLDMDMKTQVAFYAALKKIANKEIARYNKAEKKSRSLLSKTTPEAVKECFKGTLPSNLKIFKVLFEEPSSRFKIQNDLLYSSIATQNLSMAHNKLYGLFNSQGGVSGYKTKQGTTIYWGDILGKTWKPDTLRKEGGVRNQSNSDSQMYTLLDQAQMYIDFTAKGYYLQAYTKVLSMLKLFGLSRGKINASLIPKVVVYKKADGTVDIEKTMATAGLDENGNPIYDDIEGINHNEAFMLLEDSEYSKNICGICIGYSDAHILKLLDDPRVQQIIGFHDKTDDGSKRYKGARYAKNYNGLNEAVNKDGKTVHIGFNPYVKKAENKFKYNEETEAFEGTVNYKGKTYTADDIPRLAADLYLEMCEKKGYTPAYKDFANHPNYYKLLADFGLKDSQGHYAPHRKVVYNMPDTVPYLDANGKKQTMKTYDYIKAELVKELAVRDSISEALADTSSEGIIPQFKAAVKKSQAEKSYSLPKGEPAPTFYSQMSKVVSEMKQNKIGANDVVRYLTDTKRGVKAEEIKWSGIEGFLEGKKSVTKAELQEFIAASMLQIEEETLDNKDRPYTDDQQKRLDEYEAKRDEVAKRLADEWKKITGDEFPIRNAGAGLESSVTNKIIDANLEYKNASFEGRLLKKLREDLKEVISNNDDFGFDSWKDALRSIHRHRRDFINSYDMTTKDKAVIVKYCNALNAYNELPNRITDEDTDRLRAIAVEADPWNRKIMEVKHEHNEYEAKYMTNWREYSLEGGKNYREILFRIPGSDYTNEAMMTHWKERKGVLAHARIQDFDVDGKKMLFIEELQSDWHNAGRKDGYRDPGAEDKFTLTKKMNEFMDEFFKSPTAKMFEERISTVGYEGAGVSMMLNYLIDEMDYTLDVLSRKGVSFTDSEKSEIEKYAREYEELHKQWENAPGDLTAPDAPFKETYHEYVLKRLLREAAEQGYDSIGWTTAETQDERWKNNLPHKEGTGKSGFLKGYTVEYDQNIRNFLDRFGKKWGTKVGMTNLPNGTEVWSMDITDSMKDSVLYDGQVMYSLPKAQNQTYRKPAYDQWDVGAALDDALDHADQHNDNLIKVGNMPNFVKDLIGIDGDFYIYRNHAYENMVSKKDAEKAHRPTTTKSGKDIHFHNLGKQRMSDAILSLENPIMTIEDSDEFGNPEIVMILPVRGNNNSPLYAAMSFYSDVKINGKFGRKPHIVLTISERGLKADGGYDGHLEVINKAIKNGKVLSFDKEKMRDHLSVIANHTRVGNITSKSLTDNIAHFRKFVNAFREKNNIDYKLPIGEDTSPRALLANAFEGIISNDIEKRKIQEYKGKVEKLNAEEQKLHELRAQIKELSFAKGKRDTKKINDLRFDANQTASRIATLDKTLLGLEASAPLQNILKREKEMAYKRAEQKGKETLEAYKKAEQERDQKWQSEVKEKYQAYKKAEQERDQKWQSEVKEKYQASKKKAIETREKREAREKLQKLVLDTVKWISYPSKTDVKCPDILKQPYADFLNGIDLSSKRLADGGDPTKNDLRLANAMGSLATVLDKIMTSQDPAQETDKVLDIGYLDLPADFVKKLRDMTENVKGMMVEGDYVVNNMYAAEVRQLSQMIRTLNHAIKEVSTLYANLRFANVEELGGNTMEFLDALGEIEKTSGVGDFVKWDNALPFYAFKRFGKGGESIFEGLMDAQDKLAFLAKKIFDFQEKTWKGKEAKAWSEDTHTIDLPNGNKLTLTTADAMSIYCLSRREQGLQHLLGGGTRVIGIKKGSKKAKDSRSVLTMEDIVAINSSLTDRQREVAEAIQEFLSTVCSEWGNEISMKRFLTKEFLEKFYFPIESNDENLPTKDPAAQQSDLFRLLNISATKPLTPGANNEVIVRNIFDVFTGHASDMARLNAYGMALLDYMKWLNYREKAINEEGQIKVRGVRKSMEQAYGNAAKSYALNLVKDVNGRPSDGGDPNILMKWMRSAKTASVGNSLRVATLQVTSYPRAALVLSSKSLALGLTKLPQIEKAKKYCGIALWKSFGFYDTNISRSIEDQMKGVKDIKQKLIELSLKGAEWGDAITWGCLWNACEYEVAKTTKNKVGSEEFYQEVGKKLRDVVYRTQVVDSTLTRSEMMRSKRGMAQEAAAFMSEPTLSANILMDAGFEFNMEKRRTGSAKTAWKNTGKYITRAVAVYSIGQLTAALLEGLWDAWRDDDDEEFGEKFQDAFVENMVLDLVPFNKIPIVSDIFEAVLSMFDVGFYSSDKMSTTWITQAVSAVDAWKEVLDGESSKTAYNALYNTTRAISSFFGVSISGVMREGVAIWNNTAGAYDSTWKIRQYEPSKTDLGNSLYYAIVSGNKRQAESIKAEIGDGAKNDKEYKTAIDTALRKALRENDPRIKEAAEAQISGDMKKRVEIARKIAAEGNFTVSIVNGAINSEITAIKKEAKESKNSK